MEDLLERLDDLEDKLDHFSNDLNVLKQLHGFQDSQAQLNKIRYISEGVCTYLCKEHSVTWGDKEPTLERMLGPLRAAKVLPAPIHSHLRSIQSTTSPGSHYQQDKLTESHCQIALLALIEVLDWYIKKYDNGLSSQSERRESQTKLTSNRMLLAMTGLCCLLVIAGGYLWLNNRTPQNHPAMKAELSREVIEMTKENFSKRHYDMIHFLQQFKDGNQPEQQQLDTELVTYRTMIRDYNIERGNYRLDIESIFGEELYLWEREVHLELLYAGRNLECLINQQGDAEVIYQKAMEHLSNASEDFRQFHKQVQGVLNKTVVWPIPVTRTKKPVDVDLEHPC